MLENRRNFTTISFSRGFVNVKGNYISPDYVVTVNDLGSVNGKERCAVHLLSDNSLSKQNDNYNSYFNGRNLEFNVSAEKMAKALSVASISGSIVDLTV